MKKTIAELKALFETGDKPDQQAFIDLIDSLADGIQAYSYEVMDSPTSEVVFSGLSAMEDGGYQLSISIVANAPNCDFHTYFNEQIPVNHRNTKLATSATTAAAYATISGMLLKASTGISTPSYILTGNNWEPTGGIGSSWFTLELSAPRSLGRVYLYSDRATTNRWDIYGSNDNSDFASVGFIQCAPGGVTAIVDNPIAYKFYKFLYVSGSGGPYHNGLTLYDYNVGNPIICGEILTSIAGNAVGNGSAMYANDGTTYISAPQLISPNILTSIAISSSVANGIGVGSKFKLIKRGR